MARHEWDATWSGRWPNLCSGEWTLTCDGTDVSDRIPPDLRTEDMGTRGRYDVWYFEGWSEQWDDYEDGMECDEWIEANMDWLKGLSIDHDDLVAIYEAFQASDFRHSSCGGCI